MLERTTSYWERNLPAVTTTSAMGLPNAVDVLIVGAGFMGRWLAFWLSRQTPSSSILVVERDHFGYGASTRNAGFLTCGHVSECLEDERLVGFDRVAANFLARREGVALVRETFPDLELDPCGAADFDAIDDEKRDLAARLNKAAGERYFEERELDFAGQSRRVHYSKHDAGLDPVALLNRLARATTATFAFGHRVDAIAHGRAHIGAHELRYERAFVCVNAFASTLDPGTGVEPGRGQVLVTTPVATTTARVLGYLDRGYDYFRFVDGRLLLGGGRQLDRTAEATTELRTTEPVTAHLRAVARRIIGHDEWSIAHHWAGVMGFVDGAHIGSSPRRHLDDRTEIIAGFGGMGVALTPTTARRVAAQP